MGNLSKKELYEVLRETPKEEFVDNEKFNEYIELTIYSMLSRNSFFGPFMIHMHRVIDRKLKAPAAVSLNLTGFDLILNPEMLMMYTEKEIEAVLIHEIYHIVNYHLYRIKPYVQQYRIHTINIACDASINQYIENLPKGGVTIEGLEKDFDIVLERKREFDYYLEKIVQSDKYKEIQDKMDELARKFKSALEENSDEDGNITREAIEKALEESGITLGEALSDHEQDVNDMSGSMSEEVVKDMINDLVSKSLQSSRGNIPNGLEIAIERLNKKPLITWEEEFKRMVGSISVPYKKTFLRRSRRLPDRPDIRGRMMDKEVSVAVAIDTSGSQSVEQLSKIFNEIFGMLGGIKYSLRIIECDSKVHRDYTVKHKSDIDLDSVKGGGGTSFSPVINLLNQNKAGLQRPDLLVYFTDGYGEKELENPPRGYKVLWVLIDGSTEVSLEKPYGPVRIFKEK